MELVKNTSPAAGVCACASGGASPTARMSATKANATSTRSAATPAFHPTLRPAITSPYPPNCPAKCPNSATPPPDVKLTAER